MNLIFTIRDLQIFFFFFVYHPFLWTPLFGTAVHNAGPESPYSEHM